MALRPREIFRSAAFTLAAGAILWPPVPELLYWSIFEGVGDAVILLVLGASVAVGGGFGALTTISPRSFVVGGALAYLIGMGGIEALLTPESPVHLFLYGVVLVGLGAGFVVVTFADGTSTNVKNTPET